MADFPYLLPNQMLSGWHMTDVSTISHQEDQNKSDVNIIDINMESTSKDVKRLGYFSLGVGPPPPLMENAFDNNNLHYFINGPPENVYC